MRKKHIPCGVAVLVQRPDGYILLGKRKGSHGEGRWSLPGGSVEKNDANLENTAHRELHEETNLYVHTNRMYQEKAMLSYHPDVDKYWVTVFFRTWLEWDEVEFVKTREPEKCEEWKWFHPTNLPSPLFAAAEPFLYEFYGERTIGINDR